MSEKKSLKRKKVDIKFKLDAVSRVKNGEKQCDVCREREHCVVGYVQGFIKESTLQLDESEGRAILINSKSKYF